MTEKLNISKHSRRVVNHQPLLIISVQLDTILNGTGRLDVHCKIKETLLIKDLKPALNENVGSEKLFLYQPFIHFPADLRKICILSVFCFTIVIIRFQSFSLKHLNLIMLYTTVTSEDVC